MTGVSSAVAVVISTRDRTAELRRCLRSLLDGTSMPAEVVVADQSRGPDAQKSSRSRPATACRCAICAQGRGARRLAERWDRGHDRTGRRRDRRRLRRGRGLARAGRRRFEDDAELALLGGRVLPLGPAAAGLYAVSSRVSAEPRIFGQNGMPWDVGSGNNFVVRRTWFERIGGCDERLGPGAPLRGGLDMDLFRRLLRAGGRARYEPASSCCTSAQPGRGDGHAGGTTGTEPGRRSRSGCEAATI